ncbi:MAG: carboxyl transferase domain-containing protein [Xanthobacteraceae bacterium]
MALPIRIGIINRGEPAVRALNTIAEMSGDNDREFRTIALYTDPDRDAIFVRRADEAICLGPAQYVDKEDGRTRHTYLDKQRLETALLEARVDAVWVGWGFVAEDPDFAARCEELGIIFIGPSADVMRGLADKMQAKRIAESVGVPVVPWSQGPIRSLSDAAIHAERIGYPLLVKATAGGGGRGIREVLDPASLQNMIEDASREAEQSFGNAMVFLERRVSNGRHIEVQVIGDQAGTIWVLGVRECSVQRKRQKILEESDLAAPDASVVARVRDHAVALCKAVGYTGAGTIEFLYEPATDSVFFIEVNTRLQVEHTVTEMVTGVDIVRHQLRVAFGERLEGDVPEARGHAIEVRLNAEDPDRGFAPAPGRIVVYRVACGPGIRVDSGVGQGDRIAPEFDSMVAKIIAWGPDRPTALRRIRRALEQTDVVIEGGTTNKSFLLQLLQRPEIHSGAIHTAWLGQILDDRTQWPLDFADIALLQSAIEAYDEDTRAEYEQLLATAARGQLTVSDKIGSRVELRYEGNIYTFTVCKLGRNLYQLLLGDEQAILARVDRTSEYDRTFNVGGQRYQTLIINHGSGYSVEVRGVAHRILRNEGGLVRSHFPAVVVAVLVAEGQTVTTGAPLFTVESMKMESLVTAPFAGRVSQILVLRGTQIDAGDVLARFDVEIENAQVVPNPRVAFGSAFARSGALGKQHLFETIESLVLGFDVDRMEIDRAAKALASARTGVSGSDLEWLQLEQRAIRTFCDIRALVAAQHIGPAPGHGARSEDFLLAFLRSPERARENLPAEFLASIEKALHHYGVGSLETAAETGDALLRICRSLRYAQYQERFVVQILLRWSANARELRPHVIEGISDLLDRLSYLTDSGSPTLSDLAQAVRYHLVDEPVLERKRSDALAVLDQKFKRLFRDPAAAPHTAVEEFVASPEPWMDWLIPWLWRAEKRKWFGRLVSRSQSAELQGALVALEILLRINYRHCLIHEVTAPFGGAAPVLAVTMTRDTKTVRAVAVLGAEKNLEDMVRHVEKAAVGMPTSDELIAELFLLSTKVRPDDWAWPETAAASFGQRVASAGRVVMTRVSPVSERRVAYHSCLRGADGLLSADQFPDLHPGVVERLELWRLRNFAVKMLHSSDGKYAFSGRALDNPKDQRLFVFAEVRDLSPAMGAESDIESIPALERTFRGCIDLLRQHHSAFPTRSSFASNRIILCVEPVWTLPLEVLKKFADRMAAITRGLSVAQIVIRMRLQKDQAGNFSDVVVHMTAPPGTGVQLGYKSPSDEPIRSLSDDRAKSVEMRRLGLWYPYDIILLLTAPGATYSDFPIGKFQEYDLEDAQRLAPVDRPYGRNTANLVVGIITNFTAKHPEGLSRVVILNDPSKSLGSLGEAECRRILAALGLAREKSLPVEWFAVSSGARVSMESGTENMDWTARVLRGLVGFTQDGHEVNVVVTGVNVGAQSYWNAEATMLMHTRGILVMVGESAMLLTGKQALDYSGSVSAENNAGIGGYDRIMGVNGEAQYWVPDIEAACELLFRHYSLSYIAPGERFPRRARCVDRDTRKIEQQPHQPVDGADFKTVADIFDISRNPDRKKPFDIRSVMRFIVDAGEMPLERWPHMRDAETAVVWDAHVGGIPVCMIGIESHEVRRSSVAPVDGPRHWSAGTLFPKASKKVARAINSASRNRPLVVLANLSGFDGSPESMRELQLEYGAEIGRAIVNFDGPIVFCVLSRYHGGAFVVFSKALNEQLEAIAVEGARASVLGGAPAAAVVFSREVERRVKSDPRIEELARAVSAATGSHLGTLTSALSEVTGQVRMEKREEIAREFDGIHTIERALTVGSIDCIVEPSSLRPRIIGAIERGISRISRERATVPGRLGGRLH